MITDKQYRAWAKLFGVKIRPWHYIPWIGKKMLGREAMRIIMEIQDNAIEGGFRRTREYLYGEPNAYLVFPELDK